MPQGQPLCTALSRLCKALFRLCEGTASCLFHSISTLLASVSRCCERGEIQRERVGGGGGGAGGTSIGRRRDTQLLAPRVRLVNDLLHDKKNEKKVPNIRLAPIELLPPRSSATSSCHRPAYYY
jgi:hypothetical protein